MSYAKLHLKNSQEIRVVKGGPWIYSNEVANFKELKELVGEIVEVHVPKQKEAFALAYFNPHQLICARIISYDVNEKIDEYFFTRKLKAAKKLRDKFFDKPFYRLIHSEADGLPGFIVDRFDDVFSCQISSLGAEKLQDFLIAALNKVFENPKIIFKNDSESRKFEGLELETKVIQGEITDEIIIEENEIKYSLDIKNGQKTGWFFDQRINRDFISSLAKGAEVLDAFCYQGGFGLNAFKGGAKSVTFIDSSAEALKIVEKNIALNNFSDKKVELINEKTFVILEKLAAENRQFDIVVLDPPAFVKSKKDLFAGLRGYEKLVRLAATLVKENGVLFLASCSHNVSLDDLIDAASQGLRKGLIGKNRQAKLVRSYGAGFDHPINPHLKESEYLKSIAFVL